MTGQSSTATTSAASNNRMQDNSSEPKKQLRTDIGGKWSKFSTQELSDLKDKDDLVSQLVTKYGLEKDAATRDAEAVVKGRDF
jgi:hypothetical protein